MLNLITRQIFISRDVSFHETVFLFISSTYSPHTSISLPHICPNMALPYDSTFPEPISPSPNVPSFDSSPIPMSNPPLDSSIAVSSDSLTLVSLTPSSIGSDFGFTDSAKPGSSLLDQGPNVAPHASIPSLRRSPRSTKPPSYLQDYKCNTISSNELPPSTPLSKLGTSSGTPKYLISDYLDTSFLSPPYANFCSLITSILEPRFYHEAIKDPKWQEAMNAEILALVSNNTWTLTPLPSNKKAIGCKWVYRVKYKADGSVKRFKARLVAKGFTQQEGLNFIDTFSPVAKLTTVKTLLAISAVKGWHLVQLDVNKAFLNVDLHEEVYATPSRLSQQRGECCLQIEQVFIWA